MLTYNHHRDDNNIQKKSYILPKLQGGFRYKNPSIIFPGRGGGLQPPKPPSCSGAHNYIPFTFMTPRGVALTHVYIQPQNITQDHEEHISNYIKRLKKHIAKCKYTY